MRRAILTLAAVCGFSLCACGSAEERVQEEGDAEEAQMETAAEEEPAEKEEKKKPAEGSIAIFMPGSFERSWGIEARTLRWELEQKGYEVTVRFAKDRAQQCAQIAKVLQKEPQGLLIAPLDSGSIEETLEPAVREGIPVLAYGELLMDTEAVDAYVTYDYYDVGRQIGESIAGQAEKTPGQTLEIRPKKPKTINQKVALLGLQETLEPCFAGGTLKRADGTKPPEIFCRFDTETAEDGAESWCGNGEVLAKLAAEVLEDYVRGEQEEKDAVLLYDNGVKIVPAYVCPMERAEKDVSAPEKQ